MHKTYGKFTVSDEKEMLQLDRVREMMRSAYWTDEKDIEILEKAIAAGMCFGVYEDGRQIAYSRVVSDFTTMYWIADVIVDEAYRGEGVGTILMEAIVGHERLQGLSAMLVTRDAHGFYERFGFERVENKFMSRKGK